MKPAGKDLRANFNYRLAPGEWKLVGTSEYNLVPEGHVGLVCSRSGLALRGVIVLNAPGIVDEDYRGEIKVILMNVGKDTYLVEEGERIAQLVITPCIPWDLAGERGEGGFGSTGRI